MRRVLLSLACVLLPACGGGEVAPTSPSAALIAALCPPGAWTATEYRFGLADRAALLQDRFEEATDEDFGAWLSEGRGYEDGMGLTEDEFRFLLRAWEERKQTILNFGKVVIEFAGNEELVRVIAGSSLATLYELELLPSADAIRTPWGEVQGSVALRFPSSQDHTLAPFEGRVWLLEEGDWDAAEHAPDGTAKRIELWIGSRGPTREAVFYFRVSSRRSGVTYVHDEVVLRYLVA